jgi:hypothetical protein
VTGLVLAQNELDQAAACVERQPNAAALAAVAYDVLCSWADGRSLFGGQKFMVEVATRCGVTHATAATALGNVLELLELGAQSSAEVALISAFAARGFADAFAAATGSEQSRLADQFVGRLDWLEVATDYRVTPYIDRLLGRAAARGLLDATYRAVLRDDSADAKVDVAVRARNAARLSVLARAGDPTAQSELRALRKQALDPTSRALAAALVNEAVVEATEAALDEPLYVSGVSRPPSRSLPVALLRWLSGFALLQAVQRFLCFVVALRRELEVELRGEALRVRSRTLLMGRTLRSTDACYELWRVTGAFRRARFALLRAVIGMISLSTGVLIGGYLVFDGARGGAPWLLLIGAAVVAAGSSVDLALNVLLPARHARVDVQFDLRGAGSVRLGRVPQADADRLLNALSLRLSR